MEDGNKDMSLLVPCRYHLRQTFHDCCPLTYLDILGVIDPLYNKLIDVKSLEHILHWFHLLMPDFMNF